MVPEEVKEKVGEGNRVTVIETRKKVQGSFGLEKKTAKSMGTRGGVVGVEAGVKDWPGHQKKRHAEKGSDDC